MKVHSATLAGGNNNQDRLFVTDNAVIMLDGATAFEPVDVDPGLYAETIGAVIAEQLDQQPDLSIADAVATAITHAVQTLSLTAGRSPASTVSVLCARPGVVDLYVLGDSPIHYGTGGGDQMLTDHRLSTAADSERYTSRLRARHGYGADHQTAIVELQRAQRRARNRDGGYWIAETDPRAAQHGLTATIDPDASTWAVLATDGAADLVEHAGHSWADISRHDSDQLAALLARLHQWESTADPHGSRLPRAKQHDDKTIAAISTVR